MSTRVPNVFLSSTFYDLRQLRADLLAFVTESLGYNLLASESAEFPVDATDAIENCQRRVERDADMFVLVIGSRYGSIASNADVSVTNLEYRVAQLKGIPIFAFVQRETLTLFEVWKRNPSTTFDGLVDSPRLFEFIERIRDKDKIWTFSFDLAAEIIAILRRQFAYMMTTGIDVSRQISGGNGDLASLGSEGLRLLIDRPLGWPVLLFATILGEQLRLLAPRRLEHDRCVALGSGEIIAEEGLATWLQSCIAEAQRIVDAVRIAPERITAAIGGVDVNEIRASAADLVGAYRASLEWACRLRRAYVPSFARDLIREKSLWLDAVLLEIEELSAHIFEQVAMVAQHALTGNHIVNITLPIKMHNTERIEIEYARMTEKLEA
jgi:hypothetical protein